MDQSDCDQTTVIESVKNVNKSLQFNNLNNYRSFEKSNLSDFDEILI